ncbi:MAG: DUF4431 domain-containing protein [Bacteroidales bacterium]|jgi:hypothetical protein|nr:DUF4431 domain-containing protein [Bacteroidales bacterium]
MKTKYVSFFAFLVSICFFACCTNTSTSHNEANTDSLSQKAGIETISAQTDYYYEPEVSIITGTIIVETFFGPPGYGENPQTDSKEEAYILLLESPINVLSTIDESEREEGDGDFTKYNVAKIQLASTAGVLFANYTNQQVIVTGTLFSAISGHHHTDVLMDVQNIEKN